MLAKTTRFVFLCHFFMTRNKKYGTCNKLLSISSREVVLGDLLRFFVDRRDQDEKMKLLENSSFEALSSQLCVETGDSHILGR